MTSQSWASADPLEKMDEKLKSEKHAKKSSFLCLCDISIAIKKAAVGRICMKGRLKPGVKE